MYTDILIAGTGCSGLFCALNLPTDKKITLITKSSLEDSDSFLAQGGICVLKDENDYNSFFEDTLRAGHYENSKDSVDIMIKSSREIINDLIDLGVDFEKDDSGNLLYTKEGAHSTNRILYHKDITGKEITSKLLAEVKKRKNITLMEYTTLIDIISCENSCQGAVVKTASGEIKRINSSFTVLATGGIGGLFAHSTNFKHLTGDSIAIAIRHNINLKDLDYIQIHPTTLYSNKKDERSFLISESTRGEGAKIYDKNFKRFVNELLPRDKVTEAINRQMKKDNTKFVWEDLTPIGKAELSSHFPNIVSHCKEKGFDVTKEPIPIVPAQHYFMGGIEINCNGQTSMNRLYAIGETACNGVHGKNRLASNSLLESLVFAKRSAQHIKHQDLLTDFHQPDVSCSYENIINQYKELVLNEIEKFKVRRNKMFDNTTLKLKVDPLILSALEEDITNEDVSTNSVMPCYTKGEVELICKEDGILCGIQVFQRVFYLLDEKTEFEFYAKDGDVIKKGELIGKITGDIRVLLSGERTALNYLQRMSGIATYTHQVADLLKGSNTKLLDTRKTTPNNRIFEKYSVKVGGGNNHRYNLSDGILLKDNHIGAAGGVKEAVNMAKAYAPFVRKIEVEVENFEMVKEAIDAKADIIMLDNMSNEEMEKSINYIDGQAEIEVSGNVTKENISRLVNLGVNYISSGALTHSAPILDLSLKNLHPVK